jgi:hypothetical protein
VLATETTATPCEAAEFGDVGQDPENLRGTIASGRQGYRRQLVGEHEAVSSSGPDRAQDSGCHVRSGDLGRGWFARVMCLAAGPRTALKAIGSARSTAGAWRLGGAAAAGRGLRPVDIDATIATAHAD